MRILLQGYCLLLCSMMISCTPKAQQPMTEGVIREFTTFVKENNDTTFAHYSTIWYKDSACIMEIRGMNSVTARGKTTITNPIQFYRYIDLRAGRMKAFYNLSDTAVAFSEESLPDSTLKGGGWNFFTEKLRVIDGEPVMLSDTTVDGRLYKRIRFRNTNDQPDRVREGWLVNEGRGTLFSYEKKFSRKMNWTMVRRLDYGNGLPKPWAIQEVRFIADKVEGEELRILEKWREEAGGKR